MTNEKKNDGGPAYPRTGHVHSQDCEPEQWIKCNEGMSLRDYFATRAMQPIGSNRPASLLQWFRWAFGYSYKASTPSTVTNAKLAYAQADEMLKAREQ